MKTNKSIDISLSNSAIIEPIGNFAILQRLIVPGDAAKPVSNIKASDGLFRIGICLFLIVAILDIVVAWALYIFLKPVNRSLSLLTALFRIVYATILGFALIYLVNVLQLLSSNDYLASFETNQIHTQVMLSLNTFTLGWDIGLIFFGFYLLLLGYLLFWIKKFIFFHNKKRPIEMGEKKHVSNLLKSISKLENEETQIRSKLAQGDYLQ